MAKKITETGPVGLKGIRGTDLYNSLTSLSQEGNEDAAALLSTLSSRKSRPFSEESDNETYFTPQPFEERTAYADLGKSQYDEPYIMGGDESDVGEIRYENQPWYDTLANGVGKMLGTAGTTFLSSLVGLPYGAVAAISEGRWSALWDNDVTQGLANADKWLEENMTNYKSKEQQENPWYDPSNLFSMNFIADDIIKNMGFTLGAAASMAVGSGGLGLMSRALGFVNDVGKGTKMAGNMLSALFSATGEGMIEARQGVEERNKLERQRFEDALAPEMEGLREQQQMIEEQYAATRDYETYREQMRDLQAQQQDLERRRQAGLQQIEESGRLMGNRILLANQGLLTLGNMIQFSKGMTKSFDRARHAAESSSKAAKPLRVSVKKTAQGKGLGNSGYELTGKNFGRTIAATKGLVTEGSEEMNQEFIRQAAGAAYNEEDVNDYWRAKLDPESYRETTKGLYTIGNILDRGFQESWGDINQWEQFLIGGLTGMAGSYMPSKIFNQDKTKNRWDPRRYGEWSGGAYNEVRDFNREYNQLQENVDDVNKILQQEDFPSRVSSMVGHTFLETQKTDAVDADNMKAWKDADDKQNIHDIQAFLRIGKLDDLRAIYQEMSNNLSDEDVDNIVKSTTKEITAEEDKQNFIQEADNQIGEHQRKITRLQEENAAIDAQEEGMSSDEIATYRTSVQPKKEEIEQKIAVENSAIQQLEQQKNDYAGQKRYEGSYVDAQGNKTATNDEIREEVKHNAEELNRKLDSYLDSIETVRRMTNGNLNKEQEDNLAYLHNVSAEKTARVDKIMGKVRKSLPSQFLIKTNKTPEQLTKQFASSDLAFTKKDDTKEGYVEVDTSLMNDKAFASFFISNIIGGQNIEVKDEKEGQKESEEQLRTNEGLIRQAFVNNAMRNNGQSLEQALQSEEYDQLITDINDAVQLHSEAGEFYNTYLNYMLNPQKVEQDKAKEEKKIETKVKNDKADKTSMDEMLKMSDIDLGSILSDSKKGKNKAGNKARKALGMKNGRAKVQKELDAAVKAGTLDEETANDAITLFDEQLRRMSMEEDDANMSDMDNVVSKMFDLETEAMNDGELLLTDRELDDINNGRVEFDEEAYDARVSKAKDALASVTDGISAEIKAIEDSLDKDMLNKALDDEETPSQKADAAVSKAAEDNLPKYNPSAPKNQKTKVEDSAPMKPVTNMLKTKKQQEENPVTYQGDPVAVNSDRIAGQSGKNIPESESKSSWHPWMSSTSEVGQYTNVPYEPSAEDPDGAFKKQRYEAIKKKLEETGAYTRRKEGKIKEGMKVGFVVFQDVNDAAGDFVVFTTDEQGNIIGDLPSNDPRLATSKRDVPMDALYEEIRKEWEDASDDDKKNGMKSRFTSEVEHVLVGKVLYQPERQTVAQLFQGKSEPILFAVKTTASVASSSLQTHGVNAKDILYPKTGNIGQPYLLIQTPGMHRNREGFKYYAVPVSTKTIGEMDENTKYLKVLRQLFNRIKRKDLKGGISSDAEAKKLLQSLLAVANVHVNLDDNSSTKKGLGIRITVVNDQHQLVPITLHTGKREDMNIDAIMNNLKDVYANFSLDYINGTDSKKIKQLLTVDGHSIGDYNEMMAEIAETNAADTKTVNDWFTVRPLVRRGDNLIMTEVDDELPTWTASETGVVHVGVHIKGYSDREWSVDTTDGFRVYDEFGNEIVPTKENGSKHTAAEKTQAAIIAAEVFGAHHGRNSDEQYPVTLWGQTQIYDPKKQRFSKNKTVDAILKEANSEGRQLTEEEKYDVLSSYLEGYKAEEKEEDAAVAQQHTEQPQTDHSEEVRKKIAEMEEESSHYHLVKWNEEQGKYVADPEGDYYQDDRTQAIHARVSNVTDADMEIIEANKKAGFGKVNPQLKTASTGAGNAVDRFVRDYFRNGNVLKGIGIITDSFDRLPTEIKAKIEDTLRGIRSPNIRHEYALNLVIALHNFAEELGADWEINSTGLVASGIVSFDGENSVAVAGTIDLLAYNQKTGQYAIVDMKSSLAPLFTDKGKIKQDAKTKAKMEHWRAQQTLYKNFLEKKFGIKISGIRILPFSVKYSTQFAETDYTVDEGVLLDRGHVVDISPAYMGKLIPLTPKTDVQYQTAQLPDSVKRLMPKKVVTTKPEDEEVTIKGQLVKLADSVPEGYTIKQFISKDYADNQDVQKLADILESNKTASKPVLMTMASQDLLLQAIDQDALNKAIQEEEAKKHQIIIDVPKEESLDLDTILQQFTDEEQQLLSDVPEELLLKITNANIVSRVEEILQDSADPDEVSEYLESLSEAARHKKAKTGNYKKLDLQRELRWLHKNLPQVSKERKLQIIKGLIACSDGTMDFGRVEHGIMTIGTQSEEGTVYHEAFHYVVQFLMTDEEIEAMFKAAQERYGKMPEVALEERLADDFADYVKGIDPEESRIRRFFRELWNAIKAMFNNRPYIETLFRNINTGVYSGREFRDDRMNAFAAITPESRQLAKTFEYLTDDERQRITDANISREVYNSLPKEQQEYLLHCVV